MIAASPLVMECRVVDIYETEGFESFICKIEHTYAEESILNENGKIDYRKLKPVLFEMPTYEYLATGEVLGKCMSFGRRMKNEKSKIPACCARNMVMGGGARRRR